jgi:hypothetical protein
MKIIIIILTLCIILTPVISAETYQLNSCIDLIQVCDNCTSVNITTIRYPNSTIALSNVEMTRNNTEYNYTYCDTGVTGTYTISGYGDDNAITDTFSYDFEVTVTGQELNIPKTTIYSIILIMSVLFFLGLIILGIFLPYSNKKDEMTGYVIAVNNLKYVKIFSIVFSYLVLTFIVFYLYTLSRAYLDLDYVTTILYFVLVVLLGLIVPFFVILMLILIGNWIHDNKIGDYLSRGLKIK